MRRNTNNGPVTYIEHEQYNVCSRHNDGSVRLQKTVARYNKGMAVVRRIRRMMYRQSPMVEGISDVFLQPVGRVVIKEE